MVARNFRGRRIKRVSLAVRLKQDTAWHEAKLAEGKILSDGSFASWGALTEAARYRMRHFTTMFPEFAKEVRADRREWRRKAKLSS